MCTVLNDRTNILGTFTKDAKSYSGSKQKKVNYSLRKAGKTAKSLTETQGL